MNMTMLCIWLGVRLSPHYEFKCSSNVVLSPKEKKTTKHFGRLRLRSLRMFVLINAALVAVPLRTAASNKMHIPIIIIANYPQIFKRVSQVLGILSLGILELTNAKHWNVKQGLLKRYSIQLLHVNQELLIWHALPIRHFTATYPSCFLNNVDKIVKKYLICLIIPTPNLSKNPDFRRQPLVKVHNGIGTKSSVIMEQFSANLLIQRYIS